jgi:hypothetical protein
LAVISLEKGGGGRETQNGKCARPNDDRSVASERTHNQLVPHSDAGITQYAPRPLPTESIVPYQSEQNVNARAAPGPDRAPWCRDPDQIRSPSCGAGGMQRRY